MNFISTRHAKQTKTISEAILLGMAQDGGLFVPEHLPKVDLNHFPSSLSYVEMGVKILHEFFTKDVLDNYLKQFCEQAFNFPVPLVELNKNTYLLQLFHGPTLSFKDFGSRFLANCLNELGTQQKITIMVATSGDTGSAVASAFNLKPNINVLILYPKGQISPMQQHQITCWDKNVLALAVQGNFDDCQKLVKQAFQDKWWHEHTQLNSANSINIGRLLPQIIYYAYSSVQFYHRYRIQPGYIVPTGNLGNATAAYYTKLMGFPIREIVLATNANHVISDYLRTGVFSPHPSIQTLANAMDVGNPSNFERLQYLFTRIESFRHNVKAIGANDDEIKQMIKATYNEYGVIVCPHTATACFARQQLSDQAWIIVATADPSKFADIIEPTIQAKVPVAEQLKSLLNKSTRFITVDADLRIIQNVIKELGWAEKS